MLIRERRVEVWGILMARVAGAAKAFDSEWSLVFNHGGYQKRLRIRGFFAGHDTKAGLKARIREELGRLNAAEGEEDVVNLQSYLAPEPPLPDSVSKTGVELRNCDSSGLSGRSTETRGARPDRPVSPNPPPATAPLLSATRGGQTTSGVGRLDVVISGELDDSRGPRQTDSKRRKFAAAAEQQQLPVLSTKVPVRGLLPSAAPGAGSLSVETYSVSAYMDSEGSESSFDDFPAFQHEVDNFVIYHSVSYQLVSVTDLPVYIDGVLTGGASSPGTVFLLGTVGRKKFKQRVEIWSLILDPPSRPQYLLKTQKGEWVRLLNATDEYKLLMSDVHALGHFLNFVKKLPNASPMAAEQDLRRMCSMNNSKPQLDRLSGYIKVIRTFIEEDAVFAKASILRKIFPNLFPKKSSPQMDEEFESGARRDSVGVKRKAERLALESEGTERKEKRYKVVAKKNVQKPKLSRTSTPELQSEYDSDYELQKRNTSRVVKRKASDRLRLQWDDGSGADYQPAPRTTFTSAEVNVEDPPICSICDDGGGLIYCDGPCHRHFHPTMRSGRDSFCKTLGMTETEVKAIPKYFCPNCKHNQQQCFICGELGSSVATSDGPQQVRCCDVPFCNRFFHTECVAELLCGSREDWRDLSDAINDGDAKLLCPRHCCCVCGTADTEEPGKFVQCRRCPKAWHRECLKDFSRSMQRPSVRIWWQHGREFIYCRDHKILPKTQTPARDHLRFPAPAW